MSTLERRLQVLLDQDRFARLEAESATTGRSIGSIVRTAIDQHFSTAGVELARAAAARRILDATAETDGREPDWAESKAAIVGDADRSVGADGAGR
ncbi:antitoxin [Serinibacter arcticus]|uniref:Antitoxin n=1 Tax=Serinibacter arcticus TaxID=1655435 RepID=A0A2U1ZWC9_9MICO|nr:antitoxin [Serinibacter arcticus]PWD51243.1 antitoxin [Serinibacter arcticus]